MMDEDPPDRRPDTRRPPIECLGDYPDLPSYMRGELEHLMDPAVTFVLDYVDYDALLTRFEGALYRYFWDDGSVYRLSVHDVRAWRTRGL